MERGTQRLKLDSYLLKAGKLTEAQLAEVRERQQGSKRALQEVLVELGYADEKDIFSWLNTFTNLPTMDSLSDKIEENAAKVLPYKFTVSNGVLPIRFDENDLIVAMSNPLDINTVDEMRRLTGRNIRPVLARHSEILKAIEKVNQFDDTVYDVLKNILVDEDEIKVVAGDDEEEDRAGVASADLSLENPIVRIVNLILTDAVKTRASDIHIEPFETELQIKYRVDGMLKQIMKLPPAVAPRVIARIKVLASLDIAEKRAPQDGRAFIVTREKKVDLRVSTLPTMYGEKIVMRLLDKTASVIGLDKMGFTEAENARIEKIIQRPYGIFLVVGPTGSGKSTTLYSILRHIKREDNNVITVEDPVEYELKGINQVQVNVRAKLTFPTALRAILRQDPDIVMIGEIRDGETAEIAVRASMTGHLVMSTAHTNDSASAVTRLVDIGVDKFMIAGSLLGVIAQRLLRKVCVHCRAPYTPDGRLLALIAEQVPFPDGQVFYKSVGCERCNYRGYSGRMAVFEVLFVTERIRAMIIEGASDRAILAAAVKEGMDTLFMAGLRRVYSGLTTLEELLRVVEFTPISVTLCPACGTMAEDNDRHCRKCGSSLQTHCPGCNAKVRREWHHCVGCGKQLRGGAARPASVSQEAPDPVFAAKRDMARPMLLVVDDDPAIRKVVSITLKSLFPTILEASNGEDGLRLARQNLPDMMILDVMMPGMSGYEVCTHLRKSLDTSQVPIILLSAISEEEGSRQGLDVGADDYVAKPFSAAKLKSRVELNLKRKSRLSGTSESAKPVI
jgi:type IV pilus assembly protein PilB